MVGMRRQPTDFLRARLVALYLLSLAAVYTSLLAWRPERAASLQSLAGAPLLLGAAALAGAAIYERLAGLTDRHIRARLRSVGGIVYGAALFMISLGLLVGHRDATQGGVSILQGFQAAFLLLAGFGRGYVGALVNAFVLTLSSALAGGPAAALAVTLQAGLFAFFLAADQAARQLTEHPVEVLPEARPLLARGGLQALTVSAGLAIWFAVFPAAPYERLQQAGAVPPLSPDRLAGLLGNLLFVAVLSAIAFYLVLRLGGGSRGADSEPPVIAFVPARRRSQPAAGPGFVEASPSLKPWSLRIVKLYVRTAEQLAKWGRRRRLFQTPREFSSTLLPAGSAAELTELFSRARYGQEELTEADYERAGRASREILDHHRGRSR
jgi:hypothetical protein